MKTSNFPKSKPELPEEYKKIYQQAYKENRDGKGIANFLSQSLESWGHKVIEKNYNNLKEHKTLEIGAGNLNHLKYIKNEFTYDIIEPNKFFYEKSPFYKRINKIYSDLNEIPMLEKYDRIISIMVLEHITNLPKLLIDSKKHLKPRGIFQASIPCQGELAFYLGWRLTTGAAFFLKHRLDWGVIMKHEHINSFEEIVNEMKKHFKVVTLKRSPLPFLLKFKHMSFYAYLEGKN